MPNREKGVDHVACPTCGNELALSDQPDGSVAAETCPVCYPPEEQQAEPQAETASAAPAPRERGTQVIHEENADD